MAECMFAISHITGLNTVRSICTTYEKRDHPKTTLRRLCLPKRLTHNSILHRKPDKRRRANSQEASSYEHEG